MDRKTVLFNVIAIKGILFMKNKLKLVITLAFLSQYTLATEDSDMKYIDQVRAMNKDMIKNAGKNPELQGIKDMNDAFNNKTLKSKDVSEEELNNYQSEMNNKFKNNKDADKFKSEVKVINKKVEEQKEFAPIVSPTGAGSQFTAEQLKEMEKDSKKFVEFALKSIENAPKDIKDIAEAIKARGQEINDKTIQRERERMAKLAGRDVNAPGHLLYFLSFEMPIEMLRSYALEAMYTGGVIVFRGMKEGRTKLTDFMQKDLSQLMYGANNQNQVGIKMEPQLFDAFKITSAPTIVYSENLDPTYCFVPNEWTYNKVEREEVIENNQKVIKEKTTPMQLKTESCLELDPNKYWKISGAVTTYYALEQFADRGAPKAKKYLDLLKDAYTGTPSKEIKPFTGEWKSPITDNDLKVVADLEAIASKEQQNANQILNSILK